MLLVLVLWLLQLNGLAFLLGQFLCVFILVRERGDKVCRDQVLNLGSSVLSVLSVLGGWRAYYSRFGIVLGFGGVLCPSLETSLSCLLREVPTSNREGV